jgi:hypothetical protein
MGSEMRIDATAYLVQGFFFQRRQSQGLATRPFEGTVAVVRSGVFSDMYSGMIWRQGCLGGWVGSLTDPVGPSRLEDIRLTPTSFTFTKWYENHQDAIHYELALEEDLWVGRFNGERVGTGEAVCALTPVPAGMLQRIQT